MKYNNAINLFNNIGQRKYLTTDERIIFYENAEKTETQIQLFLKMLFHSGARLSEVLNLQSFQIDMVENMVVLESLKKRRKGIYRAVPLPKEFIITLNDFIKNQEFQKYIWKFSKRTASRYVKKVMQEAEINGPQACSKGLRHSFAITAVENNIPLNLIQKWMGHSSIATTAIYLNVSGKEERRFAERMW